MVGRGWASSRERTHPRPLRHGPTNHQPPTTRRVNYVVIKAFFEHLDQEVLNDMAQFPIYKDFVGLIAKKKASEVGGTGGRGGEWATEGGTQGGHAVGESGMQAHSMLHASQGYWGRACQLHPF